MHLQRIIYQRLKFKQCGNYIQREKVVFVIPFLFENEFQLFQNLFFIAFVSTDDRIDKLPHLTFVVLGTESKQIIVTF